MPNQRVEITCPRCQHQWWENLSDEPSLPVYRGTPAADQPSEHSVECPSCGNRFVVTTSEEES